MVDTVIRARGVTKSYGSLQALRGVDLDVARGECVALLGPNGAGKTTMTEILEGYRMRDGGEVRVLDSDPGSGSMAWRRRLGIVLQSTTDLTDLTVAEAVRHFTHYYDNPDDPQAVIAAVGLTEKADALIGRLSGGQRRRLDVGLGIIGRPEVLFLDEPTTGFDPEARRHFWGLIEGLKARGVTILLTTHYLDEAERLADRVSIIAAGQVVADRSPSSLRAEAMRTAAVRWREGDALREEHVEQPTAFLRTLLARFDGEVPELSVSYPTLEDVYLHLVGGEAA